MPLGGSIAGIGATLSQTLGTVTLSATGALRIAGTDTATLANATAAATGRVRLSAILDTSIGDATVTIGASLATVFRPTALFPFPPNWRDGYTITYEYKTGIFTTRAAREQRRAARSTPRSQVQFTVTCSAEDLGTLDRFMVAQQAREILLPDMSRHVRTAAALAVGGASVVLQSIPPWLVEDATIVLIYGAQSESYQVAAIAGSTVTLSTASGDQWPAGSRVCPALPGRLDESIAVNNVTTTVAEATINLAVTPGSDQNADAGGPIEVFNGREVFVFDPNWASAMRGNFSHPTDAVDFDRGVIATYVPISFGTRIRQVQLMLPTQNDRTEAVNFFRRMKGQRGEFYVPTWQNDLVPAAPAAAGASQFRVAGSDTWSTYGLDTVHRAIVLRTLGGEFYRRVTAITTDGVDTFIAVDPPLPADISADTVAISWALVCRFGTDRIDLKCVTDEAGEIQFALRSLEDLPVDAAEQPWPGLDEGTAYLVNTFGWRFTNSVIGQPLDVWVNTTYPEIAPA